MRQQRLAGHGMQHLRERRLHARALTGGEHDGEAGSGGHSNPCSMAAEVAAWALLEGFRPPWKSDSPQSQTPGIQGEGTFLLMFTV
jgi:hypothetical protein